MKNQNRLNRIYGNMKSRCYNPKTQHYADYGGRGITVCDEWLNKEKVKTATKGWLAFEKWALENGYADNLTLDRIDNRKGYNPENCRWVSMKEQSNNTRRNYFVTYKGKTQTLAQWCDELDIDYHKTKERLDRYHWSVEKAFECQNGKLMLTYKGRTQSVAEWSKELNINSNSLYSRILTRKWSVEKALETPIQSNS